MHFTYMIEVEAERVEGKFATRDDIGGQILEEIEGADPGNIFGEGDGEYEITQFEVTEVEAAKRSKRKGNTDA
jgi:hypothetical protein